WRFLLVFLGTGTLAGLYLWRVNRAIFVARSRMMHEGTKSWDRMLLRFLIPAIVAIPPVAALDARRFHWCPVPWCVCALGYFLLLVRTRWEDQTLQGELLGYRDYAQRVRFKWIPGLW